MKKGPIFTKVIPTETNRLFNTVTPVTPQSAVVDKIDSQFSKKDLEMRGGKGNNFEKEKFKDHDRLVKT
jgi:hypothetical protein